MAHLLEHYRHNITIRAGGCAIGDSVLLVSIDNSLHPYTLLSPSSLCYHPFKLFVLVRAAVATHLLVKDCLAAPCVRSLGCALLKLQVSPPQTEVALLDRTGYDPHLERDHKALASHQV